MVPVPSLSSHMWVGMKASWIDVKCQMCETYLELGTSSYLVLVSTPRIKASFGHLFTLSMHAPSSPFYSTLYSTPNQWLRGVAKLASPEDLAVIPVADPSHWLVQAMSMLAAMVAAVPCVGEAAARSNRDIQEV